MKTPLLRETKGFSLIELMTVVAVLGILAAIAIPNLVSSRAAANEASAISSVRTIATGQFTFWTNGLDRFATDLAELQANEVVDDALGSGQKDGFTFQVQGSIASFTILATPQSPSLGRRSFFMDESGVIRYEIDGVAGPSSPILPGKPAA